MFPGFSLQLSNAGLDRSQRHFVVEVNVGNDRHGRAVNDRGQPGRIGRILHGDANDLAPFHRKPVNLFQRFVGIGGIGGRHGLHDDRMIPSDPNAFRVTLSGLFWRKTGLLLTAHPSRPLHHSLTADDARDVVKGNQDDQGH